jgi:hypothetical protein
VLLLQKKMTEARNENLSAFGRNEAKHHTPEHYKNLSEAGKRRQRKKRQKGRAMSESLQESTQKVSDPAPKTAAPVEMSHQLSFKKRQESAHENRHCVSTVEDEGPPSSLSELEKRSSFTSTIHHPRDSTGELPIALQQELATGKVLELIAPSPNYYKFLSGPGKRRDRRARRNQALVVTKHTTTLVEHDCFPATTDDLAAHLNEKGSSFVLDYLQLCAHSSYVLVGQGTVCRLSRTAHALPVFTKMQPRRLPALRPQSLWPLHHSPISSDHKLGTKAVRALSSISPTIRYLAKDQQEDG